MGGAFILPTAQDGATKHCIGYIGCIGHI